MIGPLTQGHDLPMVTPTAIPAKKPVVLVEVDKQTKARYDLDKNKFIYSIGRGSDNDIQVKSPHVSRHLHAILRWNQESDTWMIRGENNLKALFYEGQGVDRPILLKHGDCVYLGSEDAALRYPELKQ